MTFKSPYSHQFLLSKNISTLLLLCKHRDVQAIFCFVKFNYHLYSSTKDVNPPSFMDSKSTTEQSRVVKYSSGNPDGIQTRVVVKETRIHTPQGIKTMKSTYTTSSSSTSTSSGTTSDLGQFSNRKFKDTKWEDPSPRFKSLNISDVRNDRSNSRSFNDKSNTKSQPRDSSDRATSKQSSAPSGSFEKQAVDVHNKYRRLHQVPAVRWNSELARDAQVWADKIARQNSLQHASSQQRKGDGENLAMFSGR